MALGNRNESVIFVKLHEREVKKGVNKLVFTKREKNADTDNYEDGSFFEVLEGKLIDFKLGNYEYPKDSGTLIDTVSIYVKDGEETYLAKANLDNFAVRSLLNKLISAANEMELKGANVEITTVTDSDGYYTIFLTVNGKKMKHFFSQEQQPKRREYQGKGGKTEYDAMPLNKFYKESLSLYVLPHFADVPTPTNQTTEGENETED